MADSEKKIGFSASDNGVSSFMKRLQADTKSMYSEFSKEADKQTKNQKEQLRIVEQQIKALERQNTLEKEQNRLILERRRAGGVISEGAYATSLAQVKEDSTINKIQTSILKDILQTAKEQHKEEKEQPATGKQVFGAVIAAGLVRDVLSSLRHLSGAKSEFDLITPFASGAGTMAGMALGAPTGYLSPGLPAAITQAGRELGATGGAAYTRHLLAREDYLASAYKVGGLTGSASQAGNLSMFGVDRASGARLEESIVRAIGKVSTTDQVRNVAAIAKAFSLDPSLLTSYMGLSRFGGRFGNQQVNETQMVNFTQYGPKMIDAIQSTISLVQAMANSTSIPNRGYATQMVNEFNEVGGAFSVGDPRSAGLISQIQTGIANPSSTFTKALTYSALRKQNPNASIVDLIKKRQEGGPLLLRSLMEGIAGMGLSEDAQTLMFASLPEIGLNGNVAEAQRLFQGRGKIASGGGSDIYGQASSKQMTDIQARAVSLTTDISRGQAEVTNAFIDGFTNGIKQLSINFTDMMTKSVKEWVDNALVPSIHKLQSMPNSHPISSKMPRK